MRPVTRWQLLIGCSLHRSNGETSHDGMGRISYQTSVTSHKLFLHRFVIFSDQSPLGVRDHSRFGKADICPHHPARVISPAPYDGKPVRGDAEVNVTLHWLSLHSYSDSASLDSASGDVVEPEKRRNILTVRPP